ncbi:hypothetical protein P3X46_017288 [Hevea brasiliensis]|uniref:Uncharacterized protein n=1 Tax=Hevea brasiliensis TaxID=3981 RepID=A0ABQ9M1X2_HEVBR|nr:hypothetical protein P3X46_017288 [Hevea brasiliensis]
MRPCLAKCSNRCEPVSPISPTHSMAMLSLALHGSPCIASSLTQPLTYQWHTHTHPS